VKQFQRFIQATNYRTSAEEKGEGGEAVVKGVWQTVPGIHWRQPGFEQRDDSPVVMVTRKDARVFAEWASRQTGRKVRLPTEAEWEYAARGGTGAWYPWGFAWDGTRLNHRDASLSESGFTQFPCTRDRDGYPFHSPVGKFPTGASWCGAMDMLGNAWEWIHDPYDKYYYHSCPTTDPPGPAEGEWGSLRGGSWGDGPESCRSPGRYGYGPDSRCTSVGLRVLLEAPAGSR
jgi:formylglycine-generating enzyme required for sulfatase activity